MPPSADDEAFMRQAISLAMRGRGGVEPNPMVGCVIAKKSRVIGEGWHERYGQPHAEPNALAACTESPGGATAYVTLEPCCHTDKQTPPCVPRLIAAGLSRVVVGCVDPNPLVAGRGVGQLREAGIEVDVGVCESSCKQIIAPFFARQVLRRPYVTLKWAQTADGKVAGLGGTPLAITGAEANHAVHDLRARCDAILVGVNTVLSDDPLLTVRGREPMRPLLRVVLDRQLRTPPTSRLVQTAAETPLLICTGAMGKEFEIGELRRLGARVEGSATFPATLALLHSIGVTHLLIEPGPTLARSLLNHEAVDRVWVLASPDALGVEAAPGAANDRSGRLLPVGCARVGRDTLTEYLDRTSAAYFSAEVSADYRRVDPTPAM